MAETGRTFSESLRLGSDNLPDNPCCPCAKEGRHIEAIKFCVDCNENICGKCVADHKKFSVMKGHHISDQLKTGSDSNSSGMPLERCRKHGAKVIDVFCRTHDVVGCSTCMVVEHSACQGVQFIPDIAKGLHKSKDVEAMQNKLSTILKQLHSLKQRQTIRLEDLQKEKAKLLQEVQDLRKRINERLDHMQMKLEAEVDSLIDTKITFEDNLIKDIDGIIAKTKNSRKRILEAENESELFVQQNLAKKSCTDASNLLDQTSKLKEKEVFRLIPRKEVQAILAKENLTFGYLTESFVPKAASFVTDVSIFHKTDETTCDVIDICFTTRGSFILTDFSNKCLKKLNETYVVTDKLYLSDHPDCVCEVDSRILAVTLMFSKKVQFVHQDPLMLLESFTVGDVCRGIAYYAEQLYVCCGGCKDNGEGDGHIEIYDMNKELIRNCSYEKLPAPRRITPGCEGKFLLVTDFHRKNLFSLDTLNYQLTEIQTEKLRFPAGSAYVGHALLSFVGHESNNVVLKAEKGEEEQELLAQNDGIARPRAVCFDHKQSTLIVSMANADNIKVFKVF